MKQHAQRCIQPKPFAVGSSARVVWRTKFNLCVLICTLSFLLPSISIIALNEGDSIFDEGMRHPSSSCLSSSSGGKTKKICALRFACWNLDQPDEVVIYDEAPDKDVLGFYSQEKIAKLWDNSQPLWSWNITLKSRSAGSSWSTAKSRSLYLSGTSVVHHMYQSAFQHYVPDFLSLLPAYWSSESLLKVAPPSRSIFLTEERCDDPSLCNDNYTTELYKMSLCGSGDCSMPVTHPFQLKTLALSSPVNLQYWCNDTASCLLSRGTTESVCFETLVLSPPTSYGSNWFFELGDRDTLVHRILGSDARYDKRASCNICIVQRTASRRILNLSEVLEMLKSRYDQGAKVITFETLTFQEQVKAVDTCDLLLAPHGGGMTNTAFVRQHSTVIEFFPAWYFHMYFYESAVLSAGASYFPVVISPEHISLTSGCEQYAGISQKECGKNASCPDCFKQSSMTVNIVLLKGVLNTVDALRSSHQARCAD